MEIEKIVLRLKDFGYTYDSSSDLSSLKFEIEKMTWHILNATNCSEIPEGLINIAIDMTCAAFLKMKKGFGMLTQIELEQIASSIKLGDTNVTFADDATPEQKFDSAITYLLTAHEDDFLCYRKLVW